MHTNTALDNEFERAFRLGDTDPMGAIKAFTVVRDRALARERNDIARSCLVQIRLLAAVLGDSSTETEMLKQLSEEDPRAMNLVALGRILESTDKMSDARRAYLRAIDAASSDDEYWVNQAHAGLGRVNPESKPE